MGVDGETEMALRRGSAWEAAGAVHLRAAPGTWLLQVGSSPREGTLCPKAPLWGREEGAWPPEEGRTGPEKAVIMKEAVASSPDKCENKSKIS